MMRDDCAEYIKAMRNNEKLENYICSLQNPLVLCKKLINRLVLIRIYICNNYHKIAFQVMSKRSF